MLQPVQYIKISNSLKGVQFRNVCKYYVISIFATPSKFIIILESVLQNANAGITMKISRNILDMSIIIIFSNRSYAR